MRTSSKTVLSAVCGCLFLTLVNAQVSAQDRPEVVVAADVTSSYVWRGFQEPDSWGSIQPSVAVSWKDVSLSVWAMTTAKSGMKEIDLNLAYTWKNWTFSLNDYYLYDGVAYFKQWWDGHSLEAAVAYSFGEQLPLTLTLNTFILGNSDKNPLSDKRYYSAYFQADYDFVAGPVEMTATLGLCPWNSPWMSEKEGFQVTNLSLKAAYPFDFMSVPVTAWGQFTYNPSLTSAPSDGRQRGIYPVAGLSFEF